MRKITKLIFWVGLAVVVAALIVDENTKKKIKKFLSTAEPKKLFTMEDVIRFFKQKEVSEKIEKNQNLQTAVLKEKTKENQIHIVCCLYDQTKETILDQPLLNVLTEKIDEDLSEQFDDKDMIVLT